MANHCKTELTQAAVLAATVFCLESDVTRSTVTASQSRFAIEINQHIQPILAGACFHGHGFATSNCKADLRLDTFEGTTTKCKGCQVIKPVGCETSELWRRISASNEDQMPPEGKP